jgi:hypothetical protein
VQARVTAEQVARGADARSPVVFLGTPGGEDEDAELQGVVVLRNLVLEEVSDDDEIASTLFYALMEEIREFFGRDDLLFALAEA